MSTTATSADAADPLALWTPAEAAQRRVAESAWRYESWLNAYPLTPLTVLDYFKNSPFYDLSCNNERLTAMLPTTGATGAININDSSLAQRLKRLQGIEYEVDTNTSSSTHNDTPYYLIRKQYRHSPADVRVESLYYVVGVDSGTPPVAEPPLMTPLQQASTAWHAVLPRGTVIPLPLVSDVITVALASTMTRLTRALDSVTEYTRLKSEYEVTQRQAKFTTTSKDRDIERSPTDSTSASNVSSDRSSGSSGSDSGGGGDESSNDALIDSLIEHARQPLNYTRQPHSHLVDEAFKVLTQRAATATQPASR